MSLFLSVQISYAHSIATISQLIRKSHISKENQNQQFCKLGEHIIIEFLGGQNLDHYAMIKQIVQKAADESGARVLKLESHKFEPCGMTCVALLQESHISVHTWPEHGYVAIDIFTCGSHINIDKALAVLQDFFRPQNIVLVRLDRGFFPGGKE